MRSCAGGGGSAASRSIAHRNAASVLPDPVGARISVWSPRAMAAQPSRWAGVGSSNVASNHARTAGEKTSSVTGTPYPQSRTSGEPPLGCGRCSVLPEAHGARIVLAPLAIILVAVWVPSLRWPSSSPSPETSPGPAPGSAGNQVVLVGRVVVPQGQSVGEVIVFSGRVLVEGIVRGDVVVVDGPITVSGQVSGSVVALDGSVRLLGTAQVGGDVLAHDRVLVAQGAAVQGRMTEGVSFNLSRPLRAVATFVSWLAVALSTLLLGLLFAWVAPRALDRTAEAGRTAPWASAGWGVVLALGVPVVAVLAVVAVLGIPLGIGLLLSIVLLSLIGVVVTAQTVGRRLLDRDRRTVTAFLAGWGDRDRDRGHPVRERRRLRARRRSSAWARRRWRSGGRGARAAARNRGTPGGRRDDPDGQVGGADRHVHERDREP